jgi:hypothetical protein
MKISFAALLLATGSSALEWKDGKCKHQLGNIKSQVNNFDYNKVIGSWMQIWGEKNEASKCKSIQFEKIGNDELGVNYSWIHKSAQPLRDDTKVQA